MGNAISPPSFRTPFRNPDGHSYRASFHSAEWQTPPRLPEAARPQFPQSQPVPGAAVWVEPSGGGQAIASTVTDCAGNFALPVVAGSYRLKAQRPNDQEAKAVTADVTAGSACFSFVLGDLSDPQQIQCGP